MTVRLVLTDIDGTLVHPGAHEVSPRVIAAVKAAEAAGVAVSAVTGRYFELCKNVLKVLGFKDMCIFDGGAMIANPLTEEVLWSKMLSVAQLRFAMDILEPHSSIVSLGADREAYAPEKFNKASISAPATHVWAAVPLEVTGELIAKINRNPQLIAHDTPGPDGDVTRAGVHVTLKGADKYHAVGQLLKMTGVKRKHVLAIGDGNNDLPLFKQAGFKVAMGNATDRLKAAADAVVGTVEQDGFAEAIERFVLKQ